MNKMIKKPPIVLGIFLAGFVFFMTLLPTSTKIGYSQAFYYTPTPGSDGRILYTVKQGESCIGIAYKNGISEAQLRQLNNLQANDCSTLQIGQQLLIGVRQENTPIPTSSIPVTPSPTPIKGNGSICIFLFNDTNGNAVAETSELALAGGQVSITDQLGKVNLTGATLDTGVPVCFENVPEGDYNISVAIPEGFNPTTAMNYKLALGAGDSATVDFGAQPGSRLVTTTSEGNRPSPMLAVLGLFFIAAGVGLWFYLQRMSQK
jgi:murein DD-endopeptidase MepM/ murein hydrolase activator NlpD